MEKKQAVRKVTLEDNQTGKRVSFETTATIEILREAITEAERSTLEDIRNEEE